MFFLFVFLISFVFGADENVCQNFDRPKAIVCYNTLKEIQSTVKALANQTDETGKINKLCIDFTKCSPLLRCANDTDVDELIDKMLTFCEINEFSDSFDLDECDAKLRAKKSACLKEWNPLPAKVDDLVKMAELQEKACRNFFGAGNCLEKEIKEYCGLEMWEKFKKHYTDLAKMMGKCDIH
ncbi:hypothetical protein CRE_05591 [Caenorhabditis remanei]|uniref:T20D4.11-like domain-containing protein n=1 Tax=Caenorhabditis remanei TaxID=31234 RepID=E3M056_CAERE|nr:hypothetical protein CRE_05591 [Caenorhabditis remanei]